MPVANRELGELGPYVLLEQIAVGGMAEIYTAKTRGVAGFEKLLCLKVIHPNYADDEHFIEMLIDEAKIAVSLNHVNIVQIFDLGRDGRTYYIAMELIDGADLFKIMRRLSENDIDVPIDAAAYIAQEICTGLDYAHRKRDEHGRPLGIIHRDISPQNILISSSGEVKIVDFGIAKAASRSRKTQAGVIKGKYYYMSPEQAWGDPVDLRTDIFSTGIILYEVLTGQMLYLEEDMHRLLDMVRKADIPRPSTRRHDIPPQLETIVMKALAKRPADRWQTAHEFQAALTNFLFSYAPAFTPSTVARLLDFVGDERVDGLPRPRPPTRQVPMNNLMSRVDFEPPQEHSVIFRVSEMSVTDPSTLSSSAAALRPLGEGDEEDPGERTIISGPPSMMEMTPEFREALPVKDYRDAEPTLRRTWQEEDGPTLINTSNAPMRAQDLDLAGGGRPRRKSRSIPVEIVVPRAAISEPPVRPEEATEQLTPTPPLDYDEPTVAEAPSQPARPSVNFRRGDAQRAATDEKVGAARPSVPPPLPFLAGVGRPTGPVAAVGVRPTGPVPVARPAPSPVFAAAVAPAAAMPAPAPVAALPPQPGVPAFSPPAWPPNVAAPPALAAQAGPPPSGQPFVANWPPVQITPTPAPQWPVASLPADLSAFGPTTNVLTEQAMAAERRRRRWRTGAIVASFLALVLGGAAAVVLFLLPGTEEGGKVNVISVPEGASVIFDGKAVPQVAPVVIQVADLSQQHTVEVRLKNYRDYSRTVAFGEGETRLQVLAVLTPIFGRLEVRSRPDNADVYVDNTHRGHTPLVIDNLTPTGEVLVELRRRGYKPVSRVLRWEDRTFMLFEAPLTRSQP